MGIYSCIGKNQEEVKTSLYKGQSGIGLDPVRKEFGYRSALTGLLDKPNLKGVLDRRQRLGLPEQGEYAYLATAEALAQAGIDDEYLSNHEVGILYGNDSSTAPVINAVDIIREKKNTALVGSGSIFQSMNSTVTMNLSVIFKLRGVNFTISGACASGSHAIGMGYFLIRSGMQDCIVCGGAQEVNMYSVGSFDPLGDLNEAKAIAEVFGEVAPYVASTKSMTGHEMWMAGASEVIYSMLMMQNGFIAPNLNFTEPDEASALLNIPAETKQLEFDTFLSNSFGFGGTNSTLIITKFKS